MKKKKLFNILLVALIVFMVTVPVLAEGEAEGEYETITQTCRGLLGDDAIDFISKSIFKPIHYIVPILLVVLTTLDFAKAVFSSEKDGMEKAKKNFTKRALIAVIIFFIPNILGLVFNLINEQSIADCMKDINYGTNSGYIVNLFLR